MYLSIIDLFWCKASVSLSPNELAIVFMLNANAFSGIFCNIVKVRQQLKKFPVDPNCKKSPAFGNGTSGRFLQWMYIEEIFHLLSNPIERLLQSLSETVNVKATMSMGF